MQDIVSMLKNMKPGELNEAISKAKSFMQTEEGKAVVQKLKNGQPIDGLPVTTEQQNKLIAELTKNPQTAKQLAAMLGGKR